jgi:hypothetical protein
VCIVNDGNKPTVLGAECKQAQGRRGNGERVAGRRRPQAERTAERGRLGRGESVEAPGQRSEKLGEAGEGQLGFRADTARPQDEHAPRLGDGVVEEHALADPGRAAEDERAALTLSRAGDEFREPPQLSLTPEQRPLPCGAKRRLRHAHTEPDSTGRR